MIGIKANISSTFIILRVKRSVDMKLIYLTLVSLPLVLLIDAGKSLSVCSYLTQFSFVQVSKFCLTFRVVVFLFSVLSVVSSVVSFRRYQYAYQSSEGRLTLVARRLRRLRELVSDVDWSVSGGPLINYLSLYHRAVGRLQSVDDLSVVR